jgi:hypothetical protein
MFDEINLNLLLTFFWLSLSAGIILLGIWLLIDCQINLSIINIILQNFYTSDKTPNYSDIPKSYFVHFYIIGILINFILFLNHLSSFFLFIIFLFYLSRRLYESLYIYKSKVHTKINFLHYLFGLIYYPCVGLTILIDKKYSYTNISLIKYFLALILFFNANYIQHHVHLTLAKNNSYPILNDYWIFNYFSSPNSITEIFIYMSFLIASHRTSAMTSLCVWVFLNQSLSALLNQRWYGRYYPSNRYALIPFIL